MAGFQYSEAETTIVYNPLTDLISVYYPQIKNSRFGSVQNMNPSILEEEPDHKRSKQTSHSDDNYKKHSDAREQNDESESDSYESDDSESDDSESDSSDSSVEEVKVKEEINKTRSDENKLSKHSSHNNHVDHKRETSSSKKQHEADPKHTEHHNSKSKRRHSPETSYEKSHHSHRHKSSKEKESSSKEAKHKSDTDKHSDHSQSKDSKTGKSSSSHHSSSASSRHHSSDKHKSSSSSQKHHNEEPKIKPERHSSHSDKHRSSSESKSAERNKSSSEKDIPKHKSSKDKSSSKETFSSKDKDRHSSSSKEKSREKSNSKDKSSTNSNDKKHSSSSDKHKSSKSESKSSKNEEKSSESKSKHKSSSSSDHKSSKNKRKEEPEPKKKARLTDEDSDDGIDCESGASFAEALGMISPAKPKKKSSQLKDSISPNNIFGNDMSPAAMLAPTAKLAPLPALEISALPEISPNYKPRPPPKFMFNFTDEEALSAGISSKNQRTKVYSGNKVIGKIPTLYEICVNILQEHIDALEYTGGVPYEILKPVVDRATPQQLFTLEHYNPYLMEDTDHLWQKFCEKTFRNKKRQEMETWREMFMRCQEEQEHKLKSLTANIKIAQEAKKAPIKQTKMAYVDSVVKPPRNIARKQAVHGTARTASASPAARVAALASSANVMKVGAVRPPPAAPVASSALNKPKKAPLMQKALQFMRGRKR
uniref:Transcription elongation factor B polypeptide 3 n=1 Tax=Bombyx mori TaxID=7091 RepID=A0A8R2HS17_BOMMO|nr:transcription elongation factor B polypeptide 3 [Bombyx mori]